MTHILVNILSIRKIKYIFKYKFIKRKILLIATKFIVPFSQQKIAKCFNAVYRNTILPILS